MYLNRNNYRGSPHDCSRRRLWPQPWRTIVMLCILLRCFQGLRHGLDRRSPLATISEGTCVKGEVPCKQGVYVSSTNKQRCLRMVQVMLCRIQQGGFLFPLKYMTFIYLLIEEAESSNLCSRIYGTVRSPVSYA